MTRIVWFLAIALLVVGCERQPHLSSSDAKSGQATVDVEAQEEAMNWDDPRDPVAITAPEVVAGKSSVLLVIHDTGHGGWQFMDGKDVRGRKPAVIPKEKLLQIDPSLAELKDLPVGWRARRAAMNEPWVREKSTSGK